MAEQSGNKGTSSSQSSTSGTDVEAMDVEQQLAELERAAGEVQEAVNLAAICQLYNRIKPVLQAAARALGWVSPSAARAIRALMQMMDSACQFA